MTSGEDELERGLDREVDQHARDWCRWCGAPAVRYLEENGHADWCPTNTPENETRLRGTSINEVDLDDARWRLSRGESVAHIANVYGVHASQLRLRLNQARQADARRVD